MPSSVSSQSSTTFASTHSSPSDVTTSSMQPSNLATNHPIPPASEPKQFRAIGLIYAKYEPSEESFTRGFLKTDDEQAIDAVLLGRVMSLVKKHLDLDKPHLWVVYPRTREKHHELHAQVVGVWEPETLAASEEESADDTSPQAPTDENADAVNAVDTVEADSDRPESADSAIEGDIDDATVAEATDEPSDSSAVDPSDDVSEPVTDEQNVAEDVAEDGTSPQLLSKPTLMAPIRPPAPPAPAPTPAPPAPAVSAPPPPEDGYFSIRGEIIGASEDHQQVTVRIQQAPRKNGADPKSFKLLLSGTLNGRLVGHFWDLHVKRQADHLVIQEGTRIGIAPPRHKPKSKPPVKKKRGGPKRSGKPQPKGYSKHSTSTDKSAPDQSSPVVTEGTPTEAALEATVADPNAIAMPAEAPATTPAEAVTETTRLGVETPTAEVTETPAPTEETAPAIAEVPAESAPADSATDGDSPEAIAQPVTDPTDSPADSAADNPADSAAEAAAEAASETESTETVEQTPEDEAEDVSQSKSRRTRKSKADD